LVRSSTPEAGEVDQLLQVVNVDRRDKRFFGERLRLSQVGDTGLERALDRVIGDVITGVESPTVNEHFGVGYPQISES
jgi:hypothetical protein